MKEAIDRIKSAMFGLVLLLSGFVLLETINPELVNFKLDPFNPSTATDFFEDCDNKPGGKICPDGFKCTNYVGKNICWPADEDHTVCAEAYLYSDVNFGGTQTTISIGQPIKVNPPPLSIKARFKDGAIMKFCDERTVPDPTDKTKTIPMPDKSGCGCILRLFAEDNGWIFSACGNAITDVGAYDGDLSEWSDRDVYCVQLLAPGDDKIK
jgi:hypothetical protein